MTVTHSPVDVEKQQQILADQRAQRKRDDDERRRENDRRMKAMGRDLREAMSTPAGRRIIAWLLDTTAMHAPVAGVTGERHIGRQEVGYAVFGLIQRFAPDLWSQAQTERNAQEIVE